MVLDRNIVLEFLLRLEEEMLSPGLPRGSQRGRGSQGGATKARGHELGIAGPVLNKRPRKNTSCLSVSLGT